MRLAFSGMRSGMPIEPGGQPHDAARGHEGRRLQLQRAPIAQLLLVARLRARNRRDLARDLLERAAHVLWVTCKSWFSPGRDAAAKTAIVTIAEQNPDQTQPASAGPALASSPTESPHAHRHD
jgi:hypothetical protein